MMLRRSGWRLRVVLPYLRRTISGSPEEQVLRPLSSDCSSSSEVEEGEESHDAQVLRAYLRNRRARCVARVREQGLVPAVLIDADKDRRPKDGSTDVFLSLDTKPLISLLKLMGKRDFISRVFDMNIYRSLQSSEIQESLQVLPRNLNYGPGKTNILNVQLVRAPPSQSLKLGVPLEYLGTEQCPGLKKGGTLKKLAKYIVYNCKASEVPAKIVVDMTVLEIGDRVQAQDLEVNFDLLYSDRTMPVCEIIKDVNTLKAKARRLKNELYFKKRALAENESRTQSRSLSDDEVEVNFGEDEQVSTKFQRGARKDLAARNSTSGVFGSKNNGKASEQRICSSTDDEVDASDEDDEEVPARFQRQREGQTVLPVRNSISRVASIKKGKASERRLCSLTDDEVDVDDDGDEEGSTRFQRPKGNRKELSVKESLSRVSGSLKKGKASKWTPCSLPDDEVDVSDDEDEAVFARLQKQRDTPKELHSRNSINKVSGSVKKGKVSEQKLRSLSDDEVSEQKLCLLSDDEGVINDDKDEELSPRLRRQRGALTELHVKNSIGKVSGSVKKGKPSERRLRGTPFKVNKKTE